MSNYSNQPRQSLLGQSRPARNRTRIPPRFLLGSLGILGIPLAINGFSLNILNITSIPVYALFTMTRMTLAYLLSVGFALAYGITTGMNHRASHVMLPLLDVLQSVPVLGFLPPVFIFFITNFPGDFGAEVSSIILIFTAMVWAPTFGVIAGVNAIPQDIKEAAKAYGIQGWGYLRQIVLPAVYPELVWSSLLAWGGGWYLIPVEENFAFKGTSHALPGLGYYIANAAANLDLDSSLFGLAVLVLIILAIDELIWKPLGSRAEKYKYESVAAPQSGGPRPGSVSANVRKYEQRLISPLVSLFKYERASLASFLEAVHLRRRFHVPERVHLQDRLARHTRMGRIIAFILAVTIILVSIPTLRGVQLTSLGGALATIQAYVGVGVLVLDTFSSLLRISIAYLIALGWTLAAGILIARNERASKLLVPVFDVLQSIPGTALFPIMILLVVNPLGGSALGLNLASILLLLTGMQWYLLFNIVGAVKGLPTDLLEASSAYGLRGGRFVKEILLPATFPAILIGSIQAWGGGWNATIVSEYIDVGHNVPGLGALLQTATNYSDLYASTVVITATVLVMTMTVLTINRLVWRRLLRKADKFKMEA
jgi:NitT/TauT family transport system permease protein